MFDVIVLGATFVAAGIAKQYKEKCLVLERSAQAGHEFFGALRFLEEESSIYPFFEGSKILFCTELISAEKTEDGFVCLTHGVNGYDSYCAKKIIDTRCSDEMSIYKTFNLLVQSPRAPTFADSRQVGEDRYLICCPVSPDVGYAQARAAAREIIQRFSPEQRLILSASGFDYQVKAGYPKTENGIYYLPSKAYDTPALALAAGEGVKL
ncbi:MAG: hypothetical protein IKU07_09220 [Oscillospiraceae bacterium]|nr:hypothetical protein [Oscillospiraceae bacterium]